MTPCSSLWEWCQWSPCNCSCHPTFEYETRQMFGSEKWQWEQFNLLLFRLSAPSSSTSVGLWQHSLDRMKVVINPCLGRAQFLSLHHHGSYLWSLWLQLLRVQVFFSSLLWLPYISSLGSLSSCSSVRLSDWPPSEETLPFEGKVCSLSRLAGLWLHGAPCSVLLPRQEGLRIPGSLNPVQKALVRCISELSICVLDVYSLNCPLFASHLHWTDGTDSIYTTMQQGVLQFWSSIEQFSI